MKYYTWRWNPHLAWVKSEDPDMMTIDGWFKSGSVQANWRPPTLVQVTTEMGRPMKHLPPLDQCDQPRPQASSVRTISDKARSVIAPFLEGVARFYPFKPHTCGQFWAVEFTRMVDCFDEDRADVSYFEGTPSKTRPGRLALQHIYRWQFKDNVPRDHKLFVVPERFHLMPIVSEQFVYASHEARLTGFVFVLLYDDALAVQPDQHDCWQAQ